MVRHHRRLFKLNNRPLFFCREDAAILACVEHVRCRSFHLSRPRRTASHFCSIQENLTPLIRGGRGVGRHSVESVRRVLPWQRSYRACRSRVILKWHPLGTPRGGRGLRDFAGQWDEFYSGGPVRDLGSLSRQTMSTRHLRDSAFVEGGFPRTGTPPVVGGPPFFVCSAEISALNPCLEP